MIFPKENDYGNTEYKQKFNAHSYIRLQKYITQMNFRLNEGNGSAIYIVGISDHGQVIGLTSKQIIDTKNLINYMANTLNSYIKVILNCQYDNKKFLIFKIESINFERLLIF